MGKAPLIQNFDFYGLKTTAFTQEDLINYINQSIQQSENIVIYGYSLATFWMFKKFPEVYRYGNQSDIILCDGHIYYLFLKILGYPIREELSIPDMVMLSLELANQQGLSLLLFGADEQTNKKANENIRIKYPNIKLLPGIHGYFKDNEIENIVRQIGEAKPDILLIGISSPKKEKIAVTYKNKLNSKVIIPCGGMIDVLSGKTKKSPKIIKKLGLASFYRILQEPRRIGRRNIEIYYVNFIFILKFIYFNLFLKKKIPIIELLK